MVVWSDTGHIDCSGPAGKKSHKVSVTSSPLTPSPLTHHHTHTSSLLTLSHSYHHLLPSTLTPSHSHHHYSHYHTHTITSHHHTHTITSHHHTHTITSHHHLSHHHLSPSHTPSPLTPSPLTITHITSHHHLSPSHSHHHLSHHHHTITSHHHLSHHHLSPSHSHTNTYWDKVLDDVHVWQWVHLQRFVEVGVNAARLTDSHKGFSQHHD